MYLQTYLLIGDTMLNLIASLVAPVSGLLDKFIEDKDQRALLAHEIATLAEKQAQEQIVGQIKTNQIEAAHQSMFVIVTGKLIE